MEGIDPQAVEKGVSDAFYRYLQGQKYNECAPLGRVERGVAWGLRDFLNSTGGAAILERAATAAYKDFLKENKDEIIAAMAKGEGA